METIVCSHLLWDDVLDYIIGMTRPEANLLIPTERKVAGEDVVASTAQALISDRTAETWTKEISWMKDTIVVPEFCTPVAEKQDMNPMP